MTEHRLSVLDCTFAISCEDEVSSALVGDCFSAFAQPAGEDPADVEIEIRRAPAPSMWELHVGEDVVACEDEADLVYFVDKQLTVDIQRQRPELFFLHGAALARDGQCTIVVGESGAGKSTLCWALCNAGFAYMSDELAPVDPQSLEVSSYPHALCLKQSPKGEYALPEGCVRTPATIHVPPELLPTTIQRTPVRLSNTVFLTGPGEPAGPPRSATAGEAAAWLYANALNQLAHPAEGLAAAAKIAQSSRNFVLVRQDLGTMAELVRQLSDD